jgi:hypothetical protein
MGAHMVQLVMASRLSRESADQPQDQLVELFHQTIEVRRGKEWHSTPFPLRSGDLVTLECRASPKFYAGLFTEGEYNRAKERSPFVFPFKWGTDQNHFVRAYTIEVSTDYRLVIRVGSFSKDSDIEVILRKGRLR